MDIAKYSTITASSRHSTFTTDKLVDGVRLENDAHPEDFAEFGFATGVSQLHTEWRKRKRKRKRKRLEAALFREVEAEAEAEAVMKKLVEAEAEAEAVKRKSVEAEAKAVKA